MPILRPSVPFAGKMPVWQFWVNAGLAERAVGKDAGPFVRALEIAVGIADRKNIERAARAELEDRSN